MNTSDRFWRKVDGNDDPDDCWLWQGSTNGGGYGEFHVGVIDGRKVRQPAHRWAYEYLRADVPTGLHLDHLCRNRACVNPWHLEPVTCAENLKRGTGHGQETHCPAGHPYDEANTFRAPRGDRQCRECMRRRARDHYRRTRVGSARPHPTSEGST